VSQKSPPLLPTLSLFFGDKMDRDKEFAALKKSLSAVDFSKEMAIKGISTGVVAIDLATCGGIPEGRFTEIFGEWQSGKSLLMYQTIVQCQKNGGVALLFDSERAFDTRWGGTLGINLNELLLFNPCSLEDAFSGMENAIKAVRGGSFKDSPVLIVYDSLAASVAQAELKQTFGQPEMALRARVISSALRKMTNLIADYRVALVFVNQLRSKVGVMFGPTTDTTGGRAPKFYATLRMEMRKRNRIKKDDNVVGVSGEMEVVKSKIGVPFRRVEFDLLFDKGIPRLSGLLDYLVRYGIIKQSGAWFQFKAKRFRSSQFESIWSEIEEDVMNAYRELVESPAMIEVDVSESNVQADEGEV